MSREQYEHGCPGCRPMMMDGTGKVLPQTHPIVVVVNRIFDEASEEERQAFHDFCCLSDKSVRVLDLVGRLHERIEKATIIFSN